MNRFIDHYRILGLPTGIDGTKLTEKDITEAFEAKQLYLQEFAAPSDSFRQLIESYGNLINADTRRRFDAIVLCLHKGREEIDKLKLQIKLAKATSHRSHLRPRQQSSKEKISGGIFKRRNMARNPVHLKHEEKNLQKLREARRKMKRKVKILRGMNTNFARPNTKPDLVKNVEASSLIVNPNHRVEVNPKIEPLEDPVRSPNLNPNPNPSNTFPGDEALLKLFQSFHMAG